MSLSFKHLSLATASFLFIACGSNNSTDGSSGGLTATIPPTTNVTSPEKLIPNPNPIPTSSSTKNITVTQNNQIESLGQGSNIDTTVNVGSTPKSVYILLSNYHKTFASSPTITHNKMAETQANQKQTEVSPKIVAKRAEHAPAYIQDFGKNVKKFLKNTKVSRQAKVLDTSTRAEKDVFGTQKTFYTEADRSKSTVATVKKVVSNVSTTFGDKTLNIWVSNDSFGIGCGKSKCVTQDMVDALAGTFLKSGSNNDIYDWVTNIYGEEWNSAASDKYRGLIGANNEITILLTDIYNDNNANGGVIGYFYAKDNYQQENESGSNERIMFYIDAVMFANGDGSWSIDDAWPKEIVSTLAHEFVHMISFYQKELMLLPNVDNTETWLSEMLAESTEDLVATKIEHTGPRGVEHTDGSAGDSGNREGRYVDFNAMNTLSLTSWHSTLADYSKVNAFGAYLLRNYGGAKVLRDIMHNQYADEQAVVSAVNSAIGVSGKTFNDLQREWGIAVMLSDNEDLGLDVPTYNTGDFSVSQIGDVIYKMGSVNFFNYTPIPKINTSVSSVKSQGNYYYKVGDNLTGTVDINFTLDSSTEATLIVK